MNVYLKVMGRQVGAVTVTAVNYRNGVAATVFANLHPAEMLSKTLAVSKILDFSVFAVSVIKSSIFKFS